MTQKININEHKNYVWVVWGSGLRDGKYEKKNYIIDFDHNTVAYPEKKVPV